MLTVYTTAAARPGNYTITVTAVGRSWTHTTTLTVMVTCCGSDFSIAANPSTLTLAPGATGTSTIQTTLTSGSAHTVQLDAVAKPDVVTGVGFAPGTVTMGDSSTMTVTVGATAAPGTYAITVRGTTPNGSATHDTTVDLIVNKPPTASLAVSCAVLRCSLDASGSSDSDGTIRSHAWEFRDGSTGSGQTASHTYQQPGTYTIRLTVTDNARASASAGRNVTVKNRAPRAAFTVACVKLTLTCAFDASASADSDGTIQSYAWSFADGTTATGQTASHTYARAGSCTATLTVTDDSGAPGSTVRYITLIRLTASGDTRNGVEQVDLSWQGPAQPGYDVYRNATKIATVEATAYTDPINQTGPGTYTYKVCLAGGTSCSNHVTVRF
jgi:PKD repeat protein